MEGFSLRDHHTPILREQVLIHPLGEPSHPPKGPAPGLRAKLALLWVTEIIGA